MMIAAKLLNSLAVQAVLCEPVSGQGSLFARENTGKFIEFESPTFQIGRNSVVKLGA